MMPCHIVHKLAVGMFCSVFGCSLSLRHTCSTMHAHHCNGACSEELRVLWFVWIVSVMCMHGLFKHANGMLIGAGCAHGVDLLTY